MRTLRAFVFSIISITAFLLLLSGCEESKTPEDGSRIDSTGRVKVIVFTMPG